MVNDAPASFVFPAVLGDVVAGYALEADDRDVLVTNPHVELAVTVLEDFVVAEVPSAATDPVRLDARPVAVFKDGIETTSSVPDGVSFHQSSFGAAYVLARLACYRRPAFALQSLLESGHREIWATGTISLQGCLVPVQPDDFEKKAAAFCSSKRARCFVVPARNWSMFSKATLLDISTLSVHTPASLAELCDRHIAKDGASLFDWNLRSKVVICMGAARSDLETLVRTLFVRDDELPVDRRLANIADWLAHIAVLQSLMHGLGLAYVLRYLPGGFYVNSLKSVQDFVPGAASIAAVYIVIKGGGQVLLSERLSSDLRGSLQAEPVLAARNRTQLLAQMGITVLTAAFTWAAHLAAVRCAISLVLGALALVLFRYQARLWKTSHVRSANLLTYVLISLTACLSHTWPLVLIWLWLAVATSADALSLSRVFDEGVWARFVKANTRLSFTGLGALSVSVLAWQLTSALALPVDAWFATAIGRARGARHAAWDQALAGFALLACLSYLRLAITGSGVVARGMAYTRAWRRPA